MKYCDNLNHFLSLVVVWCVLTDHQLLMHSTSILSGRGAMENVR